MDITDFIGIAVVGSALSLLIGYIKNKFGTDSASTKALVIVLAIVVGGLYFFLRATNWWQTILGILAASQAFYAFFLKESSQ